MATETAIAKTETSPVDVTRAPRRGNAWIYRPNVDIFDTPEELLLIADMPGADPEQIDVSVESGILSIQARVQPRTQGAEAVLREYGVGDFHRRFEIDDSIESDKINAEYHDGSLTIRLPKAPPARRRRIPVNA